jgi:hypothetical protein
MVVWLQTAVGLLVIIGLFALFLAALEERRIDEIHREWTKREQRGGDPLDP